MFTGKDNQRILKRHLTQMNGDCPPQVQTIQKGHGRVDQRQIWGRPALRGDRWFPRVEQCFRIERTTTDPAGQPGRHEYAYGITSWLPEEAPPDDLLHCVQGHWGIENNVHWVRAVVFDEDRSQIRTGHGPRVMAPLRNGVVRLLRLHGHPHLAQATRPYHADRDQALRVVGA